jgi:C4-dicarboxylate-specific signal transduction histidine kinase
VRPIDLKRIIEFAVSIVRATLHEAADIEIAMGTDPKLRVMGRAGQLQHLVVQLLERALSDVDGLARGNRLILLTTEQREKRVHLSVETAGRPPQANDDGATLAGQIVAEHGGELRAEPSSLGGTRYIADLPVG